MSDMMQSTTTKKSIVRGCVLLSVVGAFIGMLAGMFVWIQSSTQYKAVATNQIFNPRVPDLPLQDSGGDHGPAREKGRGNARFRCQPAWRRGLHLLLNNG